MCKGSGLHVVQPKYKSSYYHWSFPTKIWIKFWRALTLAFVFRHWRALPFAIMGAKRHPRCQGLTDKLLRGQDAQAAAFSCSGPRNQRWLPRTLLCRGMPRVYWCPDLNSVAFTANLNVIFGWTDPSKWTYNWAASKILKVLYRSTKYRSSSSFNSSGHYRRVILWTNLVATLPNQSSNRIGEGGRRGKYIFSS